MRFYVFSCVVFSLFYVVFKRVSRIQSALNLNFQPSALDIYYRVKAAITAANLAIIELFRFSVTVAAIPKLNVYHSVQFERDI